jgi:hypothetical protein
MDPPGSYRVKEPHQTFAQGKTLIFKPALLLSKQVQFLGLPLINKCMYCAYFGF